MSNFTKSMLSAAAGSAGGVAADSLYAKATNASSISGFTGRNSVITDGDNDCFYCFWELTPSSDGATNSAANTLIGKYGSDGSLQVGKAFTITVGSNTFKLCGQSEIMATNAVLSSNGDTLYVANGTIAYDDSSNYGVVITSIDTSDFSINWSKFYYVGASITRCCGIALNSSGNLVVATSGNQYSSIMMLNSSGSILSSRKTNITGISGYTFTQAANYGHMFVRDDVAYVSAQEFDSNRYSNDGFPIHAFTCSGTTAGYSNSYYCTFSSNSYFRCYGMQYSPVLDTSVIFGYGPSNKVMHVRDWSGGTSNNNQNDWYQASFLSVNRYPISHDPYSGVFFSKNRVDDTDTYMFDTTTTNPDSNGSYGVYGFNSSAGLDWFTPLTLEKNGEWQVMAYTNASQYGFVLAATGVDSANDDFGTSGTLVTVNGGDGIQIKKVRELGTWSFVSGSNNPFFAVYGSYDPVGDGGGQSIYTSNATVNVSSNDNLLQMGTQLWTLP